MSIRQFIADVMELPKAINAVNETIGGVRNDPHAGKMVRRV